MVANNLLKSTETSHHLKGPKARKAYILLLISKVSIHFESLVWTIKAYL